MSASQTAASLRPFGTSIFAEMTALAIEHKAVNLSQGFPDFDGPEFVLSAAVRAINQSHNQYAPMPGLLALREAVAASWHAHTGLAADPVSEITITSGCTGALAAAMLGLCNPGDEVVMFEPFYDAYRPDCAMAGAVPRHVALRPRDGRFVYDRAELEAAFTGRTRAILLNTPHNPTGKVFTRAELEHIARLCVLHDCLAITDEVYERLTFEPDCPHISLATLPGMRERTLTLSSLGKTFSLTGWKIGWAIGAPPLTSAIRAAHQFLIYCNPAPLQIGAAEALRNGHEYVVRLQHQYADARRMLSDVLADVGFDVLRPEGTYFIMCGHARVAERLGVRTDVELCRILTRDFGVAAIPPSAFYHDPADGAGLLRFAFCKTTATLNEAARRLRKIPR
ncbi:MAG: aminotransferase class I/II-fold pyridoxal phosphate-dependent enzyme [Leptolyngbya sp. PLA3]|nr:MAG: aminotransferase class I/II-fold pyridoxal phosphate-dependent enzyme [Cyanobacteria bacterium CYA]MCE7969131.1 aminotransferase class I/II-fold pyridoxal phosphate-dependent enzyme [Leptolyngbya sp. PL-A3]